MVGGVRETKLSCNGLGGVDGVHSHFRVQSNYSVEFVLWLWCVVVVIGVVAIFIFVGI